MVTIKSPATHPNDFTYTGNNGTYHSWSEGATITPRQRNNRQGKESKQDALTTAKQRAIDNIKGRLPKGYTITSAKQNKKLWKQIVKEYNRLKAQFLEQEQAKRQNNKNHIRNQIEATNPQWGARKNTEKINSENKTQTNQKNRVALKVPFYSQLTPNPLFEHGSTACFRAAKAMASQAGATVLGSNDLIQIGKSENTQGKLDIDSKMAIEGVKYIDTELDNGRPIVVGVSHKDANYNVDGLTDHFVVITERGIDEQGRTYYAFHDPATKHESKGSASNSINRFYEDSTTGLLFREGREASGEVVGRRFEVSMVRKNKESG